MTALGAPGGGDASPRAGAEDLGDASREASGDRSADVDVWPRDGGRIRLSLFGSAWDARPTPRALSWASLVTSLTRFRVFDRLAWECTGKGCKGQRPPGPQAPCPVCDAPMQFNKRGLPAWSPATYRRGTTRAKGNVLDVSCLVLDYDAGEPLDVISARWASWPHVLHTSWSHTPEKPKARVVLPLGRPVSAAQWPRLWAWALARGAVFDTKCSDASRLFFAPAVRSEDWPRTVIVHDEPSVFLDPSDEDLPRVAVATRRAPLDPLCTPRRAPAAARFAYRREPSARRDLAVRMGAVLHGEGGNERATRVTCPSCARPSVWWFIDPERKLQAQCDHLNSCGWHGWLDQIDPSLPAPDPRPVAPSPTALEAP